MGQLSNYLANKIIDWHRGQAMPSAPATIAFAALLASRGYSNSIRSTVVSAGDTVIPATPNGRIYKCTTGGTTGAGEPTWSTTNGGTTTDGGTVVWTEQTLQIKAGTFTEVANAGNYTRGSLAGSLANWAGTQGAGTTTASSGSSGTTSNNATITFGSAAPSANWGVIFGVVALDSTTYGSGNPLYWGALATPKTVNNGDPQPTIAAAQVSFNIDG